MGTESVSQVGPFVIPAYPYDRLDEIKALAESAYGSYLDLSVGTPIDPPPSFVPHLLATSGMERGYPPSIGTIGLRRAASDWMAERFDIHISASQIAATVGTKEFVASLPRFLRLRESDRDVVLYPEVSYPTYQIGAELAGCRHFAVPVNEDGSLCLEQVPEWAVDSALLLWINYPSNPTGRISGIEPAVEWARQHEILVVSDECYAEYVWKGDGDTALRYSVEGTLALHSISKRSNLAGLRAGFYAGDGEIVQFLSEVRKHAGLMVPGPVQVVAAESLGDYGHVAEQRRRYLERLEIMVRALTAHGIDVELPEGGFYLWFKAVDKGLATGFELAAYLASHAGIVVSPGEFYGDSSKEYVRLAVVAPTDLIQLVASRLSS